ncbi:MAG: hypothetical protein JHC26_01540 [Thermofilum sp.]|jgi:tetrahydromethanopterin S-methyltransferase subunit B|uniref:hypothetical protein n=1 Tax=Thermofilum sp. TaxID=1961369 RepID=UPI002586604A|nr:hypothetical protein [Thermofilum sp.]MCI4407744.1 hypothetical protein [Thermofilum sp.]
MTKTKLVAITILLAILTSMLFITKTASAQPPSNFKYTVYTPDGLKPGAKITINVELDATTSYATAVFVKIFTFPVYADNGEDFDYLGLMLGEQYADAFRIATDAVTKYAYQGILIQPTDTYGFIIAPKVRLPGKYTGNITLVIPSNATCGETLFVFFLVSVDSKVTEFIMPVGLVCEEEFRQGIYYASSVSSLNNKIQSLTNTVESLNNQLQSCTTKSQDLEKQVDTLNSQLQEKDTKIATLESTLHETQSELATLQNKEKFYETTVYVLLALLFLTVLVSIIAFFSKKRKTST